MPPKNKKPLTEEEQYQHALLQEQDLARLQRQCTLLERDRHEFSEGASGKMAKQQKVLDIFQKEHNDILTDLAVATTAEKRREDAQISEKLSGLLVEYDYYTGKVAEEKMQMSEVEGQIKLVKKEVQRLRSLQTTDRQFQERVWAGTKTVEALENKLEVQIKKFCTICAANRKLREEINHLLLERQNFIKIWDKLIANLNRGKKFMLDLIEQATIAYDQREEWCSKLQALRVRAHNDLVAHTAEMREYQRKQDNNKKLEEFFSVKGQKRVMRDLEIKEQLKRDEVRAKIKKQLGNYRTMMEDILLFTNETRIEGVAFKFLKQEEENFMHFKYINDLIQEMESVNDTLGFLHLDIDEKRALHESRTDQQSSKIVELEVQLEEISKRAEEADASLAEIDSNLGKMMQGISSLFKVCQCDKDPLLRLLGDNDDVNHYNVLLHLQLLENRVHALMLTVHHRDKVLFDKHKIKADQVLIKDESRAKPEIYPIERIAPSNPCPLCVEHEQVSDVIDTLQHVLSRKCVKTKLRQRLELPDGLVRIHNVSACHLPKSREIIQKRYQ